MKLLFASKQNPKVDICQSLYSKPDAINFLIKMILPEAAEFIAKVLVANILYTVTSLAKLTGS